MKKIFVFLVIPFILVAIAGVLINGSSDSIISNPESAETAAEETITEEPKNQDQSYSISEIAQHSTQEDCWTAIDSNVYDLTEFIVEHPGGPAILQACGVDATELFKNKGIPADESAEIRQENDIPQDAEFHSPLARDLLEEYRIGSLKDD